MKSHSSRKDIKSPYLKGKVSRCINLAQKILGNHASSRMVENQALDLMGFPDSFIDTILRRIRDCKVK
jgi:hypothetical protein